MASATLRLHAARATLVSLTVILAFAVVAVVALSGADAAAKQLSCGDTILADATLDSDLSDCPSNGIVIGGDDITVDLNGHTIDGDGTTFADCAQTELCDTGVVNDGHDGVTVMHGSVREFLVGVGVGANDNLQA
jgi:hypothetical protein